MLSPWVVFKACSHVECLRCLFPFLTEEKRRASNSIGNLTVVLESEFDFMMRIIFAGKVYNLTVLLSNNSFDDHLRFAHSPQFIELRREFELGVSM